MKNKARLGINSPSKHLEGKCIDQKRLGRPRVPTRGKHSISLLGLFHWSVRTQVLELSLPKHTILTIHTLSVLFKFSIRGSMKERDSHLKIYPCLHLTTHLWLEGRKDRYTWPGTFPKQFLRGMGMADLGFSSPEKAVYGCLVSPDWEGMWVIALWDTVGTGVD